MKLKNFVASLLPSFGKDRVMEDIRLTRTEIKDITLPAFHQAAVAFKGHKFKSKQLEDQLTVFGRMVKGAGGNPVEAIEKLLPIVLKNIDEVEDLAEKSFNEEIAGAGLTYMKANLLQVASALHFVSRFSRKFLLYIFVCETAEYEDGGATIADSLTPAEIEYIKTNFVTFCSTLNIVSGNPANIRKQLADVPDIVITSDNIDSLSATLGEKKLDPLAMGLIPIWLNPIYHVGMFVAEWQADRYKAAKEELRLVQLRKLNLEKLQSGKPDAHVQKEIAYLETRIQGMNYKIAKMEAKNA